MILQSPPPAPPTPNQVLQRELSQFASGPTAVWKAQVAQRKELRNQLVALQDERRSITNSLEDVPVNSANRLGLEKRMSEIDQRISAVDKQIAAADQAVAQAAAIPGAVVEPPPYVPSGPPEGVIAMGVVFILAVFLPLSIAFARRIWRRGSAAVAALPGDLMERLTRLDQAVDSIAIEVERIGEGQRFVTRVLGEQGGARAIAAAAAQPVPIAQREAPPQPLRSNDTAF